MNIYEYLGLGYVVFMIILLSVSFIGWVMNLVKFIALLGGDISTWFIVRLIGIPIPFIGAVVGWL